MLVSSVPKAGASPFAHLAGAASVPAPLAAKADDEDDDAKAKKKAEEDDDKKKDDEAKAKKKAEDKKDKNDDESDQDDEKDASARSARARERGRISAILLSDAGKANPVAAAHIAVMTSMPRGSAIGMLVAMGAAAPTAPAAAAEPVRDPLRSRMAEVPTPAVGSDGSRSAPSMAEQIVLAGKKRRGEI